MALTNIQLLPSTQGQVSFTGAPVRASGATRATGSLYTVTITALNFVGRVYIEGTLASIPSEEDWFAIVLPDQATPYVEFGGLSVGSYSGTRGFNFKGSYAWIRARQDRDYLGIAGITQSALSAYGHLDQVLLNMGSYAETALPSGGVTYSQGIESVTGGNVGVGEGMYAGTLGQANRVLQFKTIKQGAGIAITSDSQSITISNTGSGEGGTGGVSSFIELSDSPPGDIINKGLLIGGALGVLNYVPAPVSNGQVLTNTGSGVVWQTPAIQDFSVNVKDEGVQISAAKTINFVGDGVSVSNDGSGVAKVTIGTASGSGSTDSHLETIMFQYSAGSSGNFNTGDVLVSASTGVTATVVDGINCIVEFTFTERPFPPSSIAVMGQSYATNEFNYANVNPSIQTRKVKSGGTAAIPTLFGAFTGPITLQLRMQDTGATAGAGQRAKLAVLFRF